MITAENLAKVTQFNRHELAKILDTSGYSMCSFKSARFLGITNGGQFCYQVTYHDDQGTGEDAVGKVFVTFDHATGKVSADF